MKKLILVVIVVSLSLNCRTQLIDSVIPAKSGGFSNSELLWKTFVPFYLEKAFLELGKMNPEKIGTEILDGVSPNCSAHSMEWILQITRNSVNLLQAESWALHLTDAWGKAPEGFLSGHTNVLGDYDECLAVRANDLNPNFLVNGNKYDDIPANFIGKYCLSMIYPKESFGSIEFFNPARKSAVVEEIMGFVGDLNMPWLIPSFGTCFPSTCSLNDAQIFVENLLEALKVNDKLDFFIFDCITDEVLNNFDSGDILYACVLGFVLLICLLATLLDVCKSRKSSSEAESKLLASCSAFSVKQSILKWLSTKPDEEERVGLRCLSGLRFLTVAWIILAHTWEMPILGYYPAWNKVDLKKIHQHWSTLLITNSNVAMDTFFVISGLTVSYHLLKSVDKYKNRVISVLISFIRGLLRLTPMYALIIGFAATFWPFLGSGPYSGSIVDAASSCEKNWWTNLLYVNNFVHATFENMCLIDSWYFANEIQFLLLSPLIILSLWKWRNVGLVITIFTIVASVLTPTLLTQNQDELPSTIPTRDFREYFEDIYIKPWNRASPYLAGILCGYLIYITDKSIKVSKLAILAGWLLATAAALAIILGIFPYFDPDEKIPKTEAALYAGFHRFGWGIIISWIIFACSKGYGGLINRFLAWKFFVPLGRLTVATYLVSLPVQMIMHIRFRQTVTHDSYTMIYFFLADLLLSLFIGFLFTIFIGMPCYQLDEILLKQKNKFKDDNVTEIEMRPHQERFGIFYDRDVSISMDVRKKAKRRAGDHTHTCIEMQERQDRHGIFYNKNVSPCVETNKKR